MKALLLIGASLAVLTSCADQADTGRASAVPVHSYGATPGNGSLGMYTVRSGETVWSISQRYNLALRDVLDVNHLSPPYALSSGQRLNLPAPQTYKVRAGDTLYTISRTFGTSTTDLVKLNDLKAPYKLAGGETLKMPPRYDTAPARVQPVVMRAPDRPVPVTQQPLNDMPPQPQASSSGGYVPPPSSPDDYRDDPVASSEPKATPASVQSEAKVIAATPKLSGKFLKPVAGKVISGYGAKKDGLHNDGVNIQAARGDAVRAAENGVVVYTGSQIAGYGNLVLIRHANQYVTAYAHLDKTLVKKGDTVKKGQTLGTVGSTGSVDKPQLHFEIRKGTKALNPADFVSL